MIDWDKAAADQKASNDKHDRLPQLREQRRADFVREIPAWMESIFDKFAAEAEHYNSTRATMVSEKIEITREGWRITLRRSAAPYGILRVDVARGFDSAEIVCAVGGHSPDGRAENETEHYVASWFPTGWVIRDAASQLVVSEDIFVERVMTPFARYISG